MTAAYRLKGLGWFAGVTALSLAFYLISLQVAAERKKVEVIDRQIGATQRDIRALETEFETRSNLAQLERWNGNTLALVAPTAGQFVDSEAQLAQVSFAPAMPGGEQPQVQTAALVVPSAPAPAFVGPSDAVPAPAKVETASVTEDAAKPRVATAALTVALHKPAKGRIETAAQTVDVHMSSHAKPDRVTLTPAIVHAAMTRSESVRGKPQVAMLDRKLLSDSTLGDLLSRARVEGGKQK